MSPNLNKKHDPPFVIIQVSLTKCGSCLKIYKYVFGSLTNGVSVAVWAMQLKLRLSVQILQAARAFDYNINWL